MQGSTLKKVSAHLTYYNYYCMRRNVFGMEQISRLTNSQIVFGNTFYRQQQIISSDKVGPVLVIRTLHL